MKLENLITALLSYSCHVFEAFIKLLMSQSLKNSNKDEIFLGLQKLYTQSVLQGTVYKERIGRLVNFSKKSRNTLVFLTKNKEQFEIC